MHVDLGFPFELFFVDAIESTCSQIRLDFLGFKLRYASTILLPVQLLSFWTAIVITDSLVLSDIHFIPFFRM
jgi:hypothetical protein